jgi:hypothetical protein
MSPKYLKELANLADPTELWRTSGFDQLNMSPELRKQLDAGVALRRYASHIEALNRALSEGKSLVITPMSRDGMSQMSMMIEPQGWHKDHLKRRQS